MMGWQCSNCGVTVPPDKPHLCTWVPSRTSELEAELTRLREENEILADSNRLNSEALQVEEDKVDTLLAALRAVQKRRERINDALGYEFVGEYVDAAISEVEEEK